MRVFYILFIMISRVISTFFVFLLRILIDIVKTNLIL